MSYGEGNSMPNQVFFFSFLFRGSSWNVNHGPGARGCGCRWCLGQTPTECFISTVEGKRASVRLNISAPRRGTGRRAPARGPFFIQSGPGATANRRPQTLASHARVAFAAVIKHRRPMRRRGRRATVKCPEYRGRECSGEAFCKFDKNLPKSLSGERFQRRRKWSWRAPRGGRRSTKAAFDNLKERKIKRRWSRDIC